MRRSFVAGLLIVIGTAAASAQIPRLPGARQAIQPVRRDSTKDSTRFKWAVPDSVMLSLMNKPGYSVTRYQSDTAYFINDQNKSIDLVSANKHRIAVLRTVQNDSQMVVSDSGIYYTEATRGITTGGHYVLSPGGGQADIVGHQRAEYSMAEHSARITNARLPVNNGEMWYLDVALAKVAVDSGGGKTATAWIRGGSMTSCDDTIPDYHFEYREAKRTGGNTIVARDVTMYVQDVPVLWLPFLFSDTRGGRHSGILAPQFGIGDIVRNSPTYRRNVEHLGYYWALNNYMDFATWLDWRSSAGAVTGDPGWIRYNGDWNYRWLDRFVGGRIGMAYTQQRDNSTNLALSWSHQQDFSHDSHFNSSFNYVTSTVLQRQNTFNPYTALATIASQATYQSKLGPASFSLGATRKQYPGRQQVDQTFPTLSLTSTAISIGKWLTWTPNFSYNRSDVFKMDQPGLGAYVYGTDPATGLRDSTLSKSRSSAQSSASFDTPLQIFGFDLKNSFRMTQQRNDFPQQFQIYDVNTGNVTDTRVFSSTYYTYLDWTPDFTLPPLPHNRFNLTESVSLQNVDPGPFAVLTERTNGKYVTQKKRITGGLSASPTIFGLFPGFGPFTRIRHSITPSIGWTFAPKADVSNDYLQALGRTRFGYVGNLAQNSLNFGLTQNFEAKVRPKVIDTSATASDRGQIVRVLSISMTPMSYDFERARNAHEQGKSRLAGLTSETWGYNLSSELLPGFEFSSAYSLFQGSTLSDSAKFKPFLTSIAASFSVGRDQNPLTVFTRLFGKAVPEDKVSPSSSSDQVRPRPDDQQTAVISSQPVAGSSRAGDRFIIPPTQGWKASFQFSRSSPRPPTGDNVIAFDPTVRCQEIAGTNPFLLDACLAKLRAQPTIDTPVTSGTAGGQLYKIPPTTSLNGNINFNLTPKWTAAWQTTYDFEHHEFASQIVSLQRDIHDWRAIFGFTQSPNGNFAFNFTIALKADADLKFDYNRATVRSGSSPF